MRGNKSVVVREGLWGGDTEAESWRISHKKLQRKTFQAIEVVHTKALGQERTWIVWGTERSRVSKGRSIMRWDSVSRRGPVVRNLKTMLRFCYLPGYHSKRSQSNIGKEKWYIGWSLGGIQAHISKSPLPVELHRIHLISPAMGCDQQSSSETQCPRVLWETDHGGILFLAYTTIPDSQKESRCSA